tara:strand:+ start:108 stop:242 length:135 start_codon:yes stop_codon:yes gene_type:complete
VDVDNITANEVPNFLGGNVILLGEENAEIIDRIGQLLVIAGIEG